jgi:hypothetical protein
MAREILHIADLEKTEPEFQRKLIEVAGRRGLDPGYLAAVIHFESRYDPQAVNEYSGAVGLIQWLKSSAQSVGTSHGELMGMSAVQQLDYVDKWYEDRDPQKRITTPEDHYLAVFAPGAMFKPPGTAIFSRPEGGCGDPPKGAYCQNAGLDRNSDGVITNTEAAAPVLARIADAQTRPPLVVDDAPPGPGPGPVTPIDIPRAGLGAGKLVPLLAGGVLGFWGVMRVAKGRRRARW